MNVPSRMPETAGPLVFDTNVLVLMVVGSPRLTRAARDALEDGGPARWASAASIYEVTFKSRLGKLPIDPDGFRQALRLGGFDVRPVTEHLMHAAAMLEWTNRDPWDRIIGATARQAARRLVSSDRAFDELEGMTRIW